MTRSRGPRASSSISIPRTLLALLLAGVLIVLAGAVAFLLFTGGSPLSLLDIAPQTSLARELPPGEPTLSSGITQTAVPSPSATRPKATPTPLAFSLPTEISREISREMPTEIPTAAATVQASQSAPQVIVNGDVVNVRSGPGTNYQVLGQVIVGQPFEAIARTSAGDWLEICCPVTPGETGWISAPLVTMTTAIDALPVGSIPPTPESVAAAPMVVASQTEGNPSENPSGNPAASQARPAAGLPGPGGFGAPGETNPLTGLGLSPDLRGRRPLIVCINNDYAARPQYGTSQADVLYEYLMEGYGITRFSGVFYGKSSTQIGPVRSARLINLYLGVLYNAGLVCSGASDGVRFPLKNNAPFPYLDIDLDDPSNSRYTVSIGSDYRTRLRTATEGMRRWLADWGVEKAPGLRGFTFGDTPAGGAPASAVSIPYPSATGSQVAYSYDAGSGRYSSGRYLRFLGGVPHLDGNTGAQLALDNVIVQYVPHETTDIVEDSLGSLSIRLNLFGSGRALIFRNGLGYEGTWQSNSGGDMPRFFDDEGREITLKAGKSWISVVPLTYAIAYQ